MLNPDTMIIFKPMFAFLSPDTIAVFIPIVALMIPIVALLSKHQQQMAKVIRGQTDEGLRQELDAIKQELAYLRTVSHSQSLAMEAMRQKSLSENLSERVRDANTSG
jgi:ribosomal protein L29